MACADSVFLDELDLALIAWQLDRPCSTPGWVGLPHLASRACAAPDRSSTSDMEGGSAQIVGHIIGGIAELLFGVLGVFF
jgi:hypothetical protein